MPIALRGTPTTANAGGGGPQTLAITLPTGIVSGDVIYVFITTGSTTPTCTTKTFVNIGSTAQANNGDGITLLRRVSDGTEGSSLTFDAGVGNLIEYLQCRAYSGANTTTPEDTGGNSTLVGTTGTSATVTGITTHVANAEIVYFAFDDGRAITLGTPSGFGNATTDTDSGNGNCSIGCDKTQAVAGATGSVGATGMTSGDTWGAFLFAIQPAVVSGNLPLPVYPHHRPARTRQAPHVRAKHTLRNNRFLRIALPAKFPAPIVHHAQKRRISVVKPKPRVRNRWLDERQVTAPHADFPEQIRRQSQKKRLPHVKAKRVTRSNIELRIPQAPHADLPLSMRHPRGQSKRLPIIKPTRPHRSNLNRVFQQQTPVTSGLPRHRGQARRVPRITAKRVVRSSLELRIPQAPTATLPLSVRHQRGQSKRLPQVKAKRVVRNSIELRIPGSLRLKSPVAAHRGQQHRLSVVRAKRGVRSSIELRIPQAPATQLAQLPIGIRGKSLHKRIFKVVPKRRVASSIQLRIPQAPTATLPLSVRHGRGQARRLPAIRAKRVAKSSLQLRIPQAPATQTAQLPLPLRRGRAQPTRLYRIKAKSTHSRRLSLAPFPALALPRARADQRKRLLSVRARRPLRSSIELRIPQAPHADLPQPIRHRGQLKRISHVKAKLRVRNNIELRIPQAPPASAPISIRGRAKRKYWRAIRAKAVTVSKFMQLSKTLAPFVSPPVDAIIVWRHRANIQ